MSAKHIYDKLYSAIKNPFGVCGLMGNLKAESGLIPTNLQNSFNSKLGKTDEQYTAEVDNGRYQNFVNDGAGYGLAQWTYHARKQNLLAFARERKQSIGNLDMQIEFLLWELNGYKKVWNTLVNAKSVKEASDIIVTDYEKPANQSETTKARRASYGEEFYKEFCQNGGFSNSSLVKYTYLTKNHSGKRTHPIDRITPHCVVGQWSAEKIGTYFTNTNRDASCNYGIGSEGDVVLVVEEKNRSWCSSNEANDQRAVTIECASDANAPYAFNLTVYNKLIDLCVDICKRNGKKKLIWINDKTAALSYVPKPDEMLLTVHRWFAKKGCPGEWLYVRMGDLAEKVTAKLGGKPEKFESFVVRVSVPNLNIRKGPGTNYETTGKATGVGAFTIVEVSDGAGSSSGWGKLKSGAGWISLDYATRI